jgi:shikimate dehydrogenase
MAGAANVLVFAADGSIFADNTDGPGLLPPSPSRLPAST